ncbi:MAG: ferredoxin [Verrucomicrobiota bacterium]
MAELVKEPEKITRFTFLRNGMRAFVGLTLGVIGGWTAFGARKKNTVWQIDPMKCVQCEHCSTSCVVSPSAVKCVQSYSICGYCQLCFGYFQPEAPELTSAAENQLCPTDAIERVFVEDPYWEYNILEDRCIGCAKCIQPCEMFGNASFYLQVRHDVCVNCNNCSIAMQCPSDAWVRLPADQPYILKHKQDYPLEPQIELSLTANLPKRK